jgi:hypothetical protein
MSALFDSREGRVERLAKKLLLNSARGFQISTTSPRAAFDIAEAYEKERERRRQAASERAEEARRQNKVAEQPGTCPNGLRNVYPREGDGKRYDCYVLPAGKPRLYMGIAPDADSASRGRPAKTSYLPRRNPCWSLPWNPQKCGFLVFSEPLSVLRQHFA